jgi:hypothetical protein
MMRDMLMFFSRQSFGMLIVLQIHKSNRRVDEAIGKKFSPDNGPKPCEMWFETQPGVQVQVDFARFVVEFTDDPGTSRIVWLFSLVLGHSRLSLGNATLERFVERAVLHDREQCIAVLPHTQVEQWIAIHQQKVHHR